MLSSVRNSEVNRIEHINMFSIANLLKLKNAGHLPSFGAAATHPLVQLSGCRRQNSTLSS